MCHTQTNKQTHIYDDALYVVRYYIYSLRAQAIQLQRVATSNIGAIANLLLAVTNSVSFNTFIFIATT